MSEPITVNMPVPEAARLPSVGVRDEKWQRERAASYKMLPDLLATHRNRYVAIHEGQVAATGDELIPLAKEAYSRYGYIPIYVGFVAEPPPRLIRMPSFRQVNWGRP